MKRRLYAYLPLAGEEDTVPTANSDFWYCHIVSNNGAVSILFNGSLSTYYCRRRCITSNIFSNPISLTSIGGCSNKNNWMMLRLKYTSAIKEIHQFFVYLLVNLSS